MTPVDPLSVAYKVAEQLAESNGWALPSWWGGGARKGSMPADASDRLSRAAAVGSAHEEALDRGERKRQGVHLTPASTALAMARGSFAGAQQIDTVLDPCCGAGIFLIAAQAIADRPLKLYGTDLNPAALQAARAATFFVKCRRGAAKE